MHCDQTYIRMLSLCLGTPLPPRKKNGGLESETRSVLNRSNLTFQKKVVLARPLTAPTLPLAPFHTDEMFFFLQPLMGFDLNMKENLESYFQLDYSNVRERLL